jgi:ribosomal protein S20
LETRFEITRAVSILRSLVRTEIEQCKNAVQDGEVERAQKVMIDVQQKLTRAINALNKLR